MGDGGRLPRGPSLSARRYGLIGRGRVGASLGPWLRSLGHTTHEWGRADVDAAPLDGVDAVLLAVPDRAIGELARRLHARAETRLVHFSGALLVPHAWSFHPLYSFPTAPLAPSETARIPFARQEGAPALAELVPGADNPEIAVADRDRAFYHALAVVSGNFAAFLWNESAKAAAARLGTDPARLFAPYFESLVDRFRESPLDSLTGPVARRDAATVEANLDALEGAPDIQSAYEAFLGLAWPGFRR